MDKTTPTCPMCGDAAVEPVEAVNEAVTVFLCGECGATWADRTA